MNAPVRLRGHHLVCLQFYEGQGYSASFVENLTAVTRRLTREAATVVDGADDVCVACPSLTAEGACADPRSGESEIARIDELARELLGVAAGDRLTLAQAAERLAEDAVAAGRWRYEACHGCAFEAVCEPGWKRLAGR